MKLNKLAPAEGSKRNRKRVGRGMGSGSGKTAGRGHKGQKSRSGGKVRVGFEGGQMPLQRRLPKVGFSSRTARFNDEVRLYQLQALGAETVDLEVLRKAGLIGKQIKRVKVINTGTLDMAVNIRGLAVTKGAKAVIEAAGGSVE